MDVVDDEEVGGNVVVVVEVVEVVVEVVEVVDDVDDVVVVVGETPKVTDTISSTSALDICVQVVPS